MKIAFLLALCTLSGCAGRTGGPAPVAHAGRQVVLTDSTAFGLVCDTIELGRLHEGEVVEQRLVLRNASSRPLALLRVSTTCGCTAIDADYQPVMPGGETPMTLRFDSRGFAGWQHKRIDLYTSLSAEPYRIRITAQVD